MFAATGAHVEVVPSFPQGQVETLSLVFEAAQNFVREQVPAVVCHYLMLATMTALQKKDEGVRGIATGTVFRRLVAKVLAWQFSDEVEAACAPLQSRAGTDCVIRVATELNPNLAVLSIDGVRVFRPHVPCFHVGEIRRSSWPPRFIALREDGLFKREFVRLGGRRGGAAHH